MSRLSEEIVQYYSEFLILDELPLDSSPNIKHTIYDENQFPLLITDTKICFHDLTGNKNFFLYEDVFYNVQFRKPDVAIKEVQGVPKFIGRKMRTLTVSLFCETDKKINTYSKTDNPAEGPQLISFIGSKSFLEFAFEMIVQNAPVYELKKRINSDGEEEQYWQNPNWTDFSEDPKPE